MSLCESFNYSYVMDPKSSNPFTKERRKDWQHEVYKNETNLRPRQLAFKCGDRFIPKRFRRQDADFNLKYIELKEDMDILNTANYLNSNYWRQNSFISLMSNTFNMREHRVLQFSPWSELDLRSRNYEDWPCRPRARPQAYANATHELPELYSNFDNNLVDWSINNQMAISTGQDVMVWRGSDATTMVFGVKCPTALRYSPDGQYLAMAYIDGGFPVVEFWKIETEVEFLVTEGKYISVGYITCLEWNHNSKEVVCGTRSGHIMIINLSDMGQKTLKSQNYKITMLKFSPCMCYLAIADANGHIFVFDYRRHKVIWKTLMETCNVCLDWHPWTGVELVIAERCPASLVIVHVPRREIVASYKRKDDDIKIRAITFSKITGELLVNIIRNDKGQTRYEILVLASLNRVVDIVGFCDRGALYLMWSPDGTKLATGGVDESFSVWNFYPSHHTSNSKKQEIDQKTQKLKKHQNLETFGLYNHFK
ncbi:uncharacterized protein Dwil_GK18096 [Drosophila willistoni]|uniref:Protein cortex n=1 Tax=Drosophila willistoni TaxID=7260 RepID=B4MZ25_DROWI|nr:protein cortex [Drosophila willistoni]EDW77421.1 uncharacterized protein Dwil_GK18096 [Drosophila willistoni]